MTFPLQIRGKMSQFKRVFLRQTFRLCVCAAVIAGSVVALQHAAEATTPNAAPVSAPTDAEAGDIYFRSLMGFDATLAHVREVKAENEGRVKTDPWPSMTQTESAELARRLTLGDRIESIDALLDGSPNYGGAWMDQKAGGILRVGLVGKVDPATTEAVDNLLLPGQTAQFMSVGVTKKALQIASDSLSQTPAFRAGYIGVAYADWPNSQVVVEMVKDAPFDANGLLGQLLQVPFVVHSTWTSGFKGSSYDPGTKSRNFFDGKLYGGQWLSYNGQVNCTDGYSNIRDAGGRYYTITAGHCYNNGETAYRGIPQPGTPPSPDPIGQASSSGFIPYGSSNCDCEPIGLISAGTGTEQVRIDNNALYTFTRTATPYANMPMCQSGAASFENRGGSDACGTVVNGGTTCPEGFGSTPFTLNDCGLSNVTSRAGDSGGPVGSGPALLGIVSADNRGNTAQGTMQTFSKTANFATVNVRAGF